MTRLLRRLFASPVRHKSRPRLAIETLGDRITPVVRAFQPAELAVPGIGLDGVVAIYAPNPQPTPDGSGALLYTGRHILTAAHVVDTDGNGMADPGNYTIQFDLPEGRVNMNVPASSITVYPGYDGDVEHGRDLAVIRLPELAPTSAERYALQYVGSELEQGGKAFKVVGYGLRGVGATGEAGVTGTRSFGFNNFNALGDDVDYSANPFTSKNGPHGTLAYDFDDGSDDFNALGGRGQGGNEAFAAKGDSGGPLFIVDGAGKHWLAGITSYRARGGGTEDEHDAGSTFGEIGFATRVFNYNGWIQSQVNGAYDLVVDMKNQPVGDTGISDTIDVKLNGTTFQLFVNNKLLVQDGISRIKSLNIYGSSDNETITIPGYLGKEVLVVGGGGSDSLTIDDSTNTIPTTIRTTDTHVVLASGTRTTQFYVNNDVESLTVKAGTPTTGGNKITVDSTPAASWGMGILTGGGSDTVFVHAAAAPLTIAGQNGNDTVTIGSSSGLSGFRYSLGVTNDLGSTRLRLFDLGSANHNITMDMVEGWGQFINGLSAAPILYGHQNVSPEIYLGGGEDTINAMYLQSQTTINTGFGTDRVTVANMASNTPLTIDLGEGDNYAGLGGPYGLAPMSGAFVKATGGSVHLTLDDSQQVYQQTYTLTANNFQVGTNAAIRFANVKSLQVFGGQGKPDGIFAPVGNSFNVLDTPSQTPTGTYTTLYTGAGRDAVNVRGSTGKLGLMFQGGGIESLRVGGPERGLDGVKESIYLFDGGPGLYVTVDDCGTAAARGFIVDNDGVRRAGAGEIDFGMANGFDLHVSGGRFGNTFDIRGRRGDLGWSLNAGAGPDVINITGPVSRLSNQAHYAVNGEGGTDTLNLFDTGETAPRTYDFFDHQTFPVFQTQGTTVILGDKQTEAVHLFQGQGASTVNRATFPASVALTVHPWSNGAQPFSGRQVAIADTDADRYTMSLVGPGTLTVTPVDPDLDGRGSIGRIVIDGATAATTLNIAVTKAAAGDGFISIGSIEAPALKAIVAPRADLTGAGVIIAGTLGSITIHDLEAGARISTGGAITALKAASLHGDVAAAAIGTMSVTGDMTGNLAVSGVSGQMALGSTLIAGVVTNSDWNLNGNVGTVIVKGAVDDWYLNVLGSLNALSLATATDTTLGAYSLGRLTTTGEFDAFLHLIGTGDPAKPALGAATVGGGIANSMWSVSGNAGPVVVKGTTYAWDVDVSGGLAGLTLGDVPLARVSVVGRIPKVSVGSWADGGLSAGSIGSLAVTGNLGADVLVFGEAVPAGQPALGTVTVGGRVGGATIAVAGSVGSFTAGEMVGSRLLAGFTPDWNNPMAGTFEGNARIGRLVVTGVGPWKDNAFAGSVVAASTIGTVNLKSVVADNGGSTFGLVVQTPSGPAAPPAIGKLIIGNPAATWTAVRESPTTPTILGDFGIKVL